MITRALLPYLHTVTWQDAKAFLDQDGRAKVTWNKGKRNVDGWIVFQFLYDQVGNKSIYYNDKSDLQIVGGYVDADELLFVSTFA
jgi:uncharacterized protein YdeI (YjbR/CyaY-like superfamily)